jgi:ParB family chromosome partitioning protein
MKIPIDQVIPNPQQPRIDFDQDGLEAMARSILDVGLINPISVYREDGHFVLVDGERRLRACQIAGLDAIEVNLVIKPNHGQTDQKLLEMAAIGNLQRKQMNPLEEGKAFARMIENGKSFAELSREFGRSEPVIRTLAAITSLEPEIQQYYAEGMLPVLWQVITAIKGLPDDERIDIVRGFVKRKVGAAGIKNICNRISASYGEGMVPKKRDLSNVEKRAEHDIPAFDVSRKVEKEIIQDNHWNALSQAGILPPWSQFTAAVEKTCTDYPLYSVANVTNCRTCAVVDLISKLCTI